MKSKEGFHKTANRQLNGWKEIAAALNKNESTAKRWAATRGLPVHRVPGDKRASVYAWSEDIGNWLVAPLAEPQSSSETSGVAELQSAGHGPAARPSIYNRWLAATASIAAIILVAIALSFSWFSPTLPPGIGKKPYQTSDRAQALYLNGVYLYQKRTPESLVEAAAQLQQSIGLDPNFAAARAALAVTYDLMVEYRLLDADQGYGKAREAAFAALALDAQLPEAQAVLGDTSFFWKHAYEEGLSHFIQSITLDPGNALTRHWYASALLCAGRYQEALREIDETQRLEPTSRSVLTSKGMILLASGNVAAAEDVLNGLVAHEAGYRSPYRFLSFVALAKKDYGQYLRWLETRFELTSDSAGLLVARAGRHGLENGGYASMVLEMKNSLSSDAVLRTVEPYFRAHIAALAGDTETAIKALETVQTRHAFYYGFDPAFAAMRADPSFVQGIKLLGLPIAQ